MKVRHLRVERFRGIRRLDWSVRGATICLVGPGDSTKSTILDAVEWALFPRWPLHISDADFYAVSPTDPIVIEATVGELPNALLAEQKFGLLARGWSVDGIRDEPKEGDEPVITVRLSIDDSLEAVWEVVNDRQDEPRAISARDRETLGMTRLGIDVERQLTWGRGSALLRLTDSTDDMARTLAAAHRSAREAVDGTDIGGLVEASEKAAKAAKAMGAGAAETYQPGLDAGGGGPRAGALGLHAGGVPVRLAGLGSRRLAALGVQRASVREGAIVLIDEVEGALEPHRLRHLLRELRTPGTGQVLMTTHSDVVVVELSCRELRVVSSHGGTTEVRDVPDELQAAVRAAPEALLGRRVIVGEGKTEVGLCRALDRPWTDAAGVPPAEVGVALVPGGGTKAGSLAQAFAKLGYRTALLADSDVALNPPEKELSSAGVRVIQWDDSVSTEERVALDVPWAVLMEMLDVATDLVDPGSPRTVLDAVAQRLTAANGTGPDEWLEGFAHDDVRAAIGATAKDKGWFKRTDLGEALGNLIADALPEMGGTDLCAKVDALAEWAYAD